MLLASRARPHFHQAIRLGARRRTFVGGAFETDFEITRAVVRRDRIHLFLGALGPQHAGHSCKAQDIVEATMKEHAVDGYFAGHDQLLAAVHDARKRLGSLQTASLKREVGSEEASAAGSAATAGGAGMDAADAKVDRAMQLPHREATDAQAATVAVGSTMPVATTSSADPVHLDASANAVESKVAEEAEPEVEKEAVETLSEEENTTIASLRLSFALNELPPLWAALLRSSPTAASGSASENTGSDPPCPPSSLPLTTVLEAARTLGASSPLEQLSFRMNMGASPAAAMPASGPTRLQLTRAAKETVFAAQPLLFELLNSSGLLHETEKAYIERLRSSPETIWAEMQREGYFRKAIRLVRRRRARGASAVSSLEEKPGDALGVSVLVSEMSNAHERESVAFSALQTEAALHRALNLAFFAKHDRSATRWRRSKNAVKLSALFMACNILDFTLSNI